MKHLLKCPIFFSFLVQRLWQQPLSFSSTHLYLLACLSFLPGPTLPIPGEQRVPVLVTLWRYHSVWDLWKMHADTHILTHTDTHTSNKHFSNPSSFFFCQYAHIRLENIVYPSAEWKSSKTQIQQWKKRRLHSSSQSCEFLQNKVWYLCINIIIIIFLMISSVQ